METDPILPLAFGGIIAFGVFMYVLMDGFDLGVGILFRLAPRDADRDMMMNSVAPIWDGNETWLVLGGAGLMGAFPVAYSVILPALYLPLLIMLIALIFRGVAFEFRFKADRGRVFWDLSFSVGSTFATFAQGLMLGAFIQGFAVVGHQYAGGAFDWLTPFSVLTGAAMIPGYALLGSTWLILKTEGRLQGWAYEMAQRALIAVIVFMVVISLWTPLLRPAIAERWFAWPNIAFLSSVPLAVAAVALALYRGLRKRRALSPFVLAMALFFLGYLGLAISLWPNIVPPDINLWEAASPPETQIFLIVGFVVLIPLILGYTAYAYWIFRGKVSRDVGYH